jgi:hypothetical protein
MIFSRAKKFRSFLAVHNAAWTAIKPHLKHVTKILYAATISKADVRSDEMNRQGFSIRLRSGIHDSTFGRNPGTDARCGALSQLESVA